MLLVHFGEFLPLSNQILKVSILPLVRGGFFQLLLHGFAKRTPTKGPSLPDDIYDENTLLKINHEGYMI